MQLFSFIKFALCDQTLLPFFLFVAVLFTRQTIVLLNDAVIYLNSVPAGMTAAIFWGFSFGLIQMAWENFKELKKEN